MGGGASVPEHKYELDPETTVAEDIKVYYQKAEAM